MLHNARISDSKRLSKKNEKLELRRTGWKVKIDETIRRAPEAKLTWYEVYRRGQNLDNNVELVFYAGHLN